MTFVQLLPFQDSQAPVLDPLYPPIARAAVLDPTPTLDLLAVFKSATSVQVDPLYNSVRATPVGGPNPPYTIPAVLDSIDPAR